MKRLRIETFLLLPLLLSVTWAGPSWPFFRGDRQMSGVSTEILKPPLTKAWEFEAEEGFIATAVIADGRIFIGSLDGQFYALELETGKELWRYKTELSIEGSACVHGNTVVFGAGDGFVYALSADKGEFRWKHETDGEILAGANIYESKTAGKTYVLIGSYDNQLYCFDIENGDVVWTYPTEGAVNGAPSIVGDQILFGGCDTFIHSISAETGKVTNEDQKPIEVGAPITNSIIVRGNDAYVAHYNNRVVSFDLGRRVQRWEFGETDFAFWASPAVTDDALYVAGRDKRVYRVNPDDGTEVWSFKARGRVDSSPVISGKTLYVGSDDGFLYALDTESGDELWDSDIGEDIRSSPAIAGGFLVIATGEGTVLAFKEAKK
ncbi:MAG: PQQ-binding-like beta-propeller repeat protein [Verrucomicrobiales bacterium]